MFGSVSNFVVERDGVSDNLLRPMKSTKAPELPQNEPTAAVPNGRWAWALAMLALVVFGVLVYGKTLVPGRIILTTDDNIGALALRKASMPQSLLGWWNDNVLCGVPEFMNITWTNLLLCVMPVNMFANWIHAIDLVAASIFLILFLRQRNVHPAAAVIAALASFWLGSSFFLTYAGHIGKFGVLVFAAFFLWQAESAFRRNSWANAILAGGGLGGMFLEQADVALFFAMPLGCYALYRVMIAGDDRIKMIARVFAPMMIVGAMIAIHPVWMGKSLFASAVPGAASGNANATWDYDTQWSWPPEETIEWIAPGYYGWRSNETDGPYWGRLGCQPGTEDQHQAGNNFKLENFYIGAIPVSLALLALVLALARKQGAGLSRSEIFFWGGVLLVTFILGLGKYCPIYRLFFALPGISSIRAPVKFMQVTQLALGILAAFGFDWLIRANADSTRTAAFKNFRWAILAFGIVLLLAGFGAASGESARAQEFAARGWGQYAPMIVSLQIAALLRGAFMMLLAWGVLMALPRDKAGWDVWRLRIAWIAVGLVAVDQFIVSRHYVQTVESDNVIGRNAVTDMLKSTQGGQRTYLFMQESMRYRELQEASAAYGQWLTYLFPYQNIATFNVTQIRMPDDYQRFLTALGPTPDRLWRLAGIGHMIYPAPFARQFQSLPALKDAVQPVLSFNVQMLGIGSKVYTASSTQPGQHTLAKITSPAPRYALFAGWQKSDDDKTLAALANPALPLFEKAFVPADATIPESTASGIVGKVDVASYRSGAVTLKTSADQPTVLRACEKFMPYWKATLDGKPVSLFRCDYLFQGLFVPAGSHEITLTYAPQMPTFWSQVSGTALCLIALLALGLQRFTHKPEPAAA